MTPPDNNIWLIDTDHLSLMDRGTSGGLKILSRLRNLSPDDYGISVVTYAEQAKGWLSKVAEANSAEAEVRAFDKLQKSLTFCTAFAIWGYTPEAAAKCMELKKRKGRVGTQDLRIASIALVNNAILLTCNARDFSKVPNLKFEDWTI